MNGMFDDLLGGGEEEPDVQPAPYGRDFSLKMGDVHEIERGVTVPWLCQAFTLGRGTVETKLVDCPALRTGKHGGKVYDLRVAAAYLVKPKLNVARYIKNLKKEDLPPQLKREFWAARLSEQKWRVQAGELWPSDDVMAVFGETFKSIKETTMLWAGTLEESVGLTDEQRELLIELVDGLLDNMHKSLVDVASISATRSQLKEIDEEDGISDA